MVLDLLRSLFKKESWRYVFQRNGCRLKPADRRSWHCLMKRQQKSMVPTSLKKKKMSSNSYNYVTRSILIYRMKLNRRKFINIWSSNEWLSKVKETFISRKDINWHPRVHTYTSVRLKRESHKFICLTKIPLEKMYGVRKNEKYWSQKARTKTVFLFQYSFN